MSVDFDEDDIIWDYYETLKEWDKVELLPNGGIFILDPRSNMKKAIKITKDNTEKLMKEYGLDESELDQEFGLSIGMWLIADFGAKRPEGYLSEAAFNEQFEFVPKEELTLKNDYWAIRDKVSA
jgi:hypothetical protein